MRRLVQTPDILLKVIELLDIDTLLSLRLTNRGIHDLISLYESTISQAVAKLTFPTAGLLLRPPSDNKFNIRWLISLIPKQLATIAVDRGHLNNSPNMYGVFAELAWGDSIRERVERGWRILQKLSLIARDVDMMSEADLLLSDYKGKSSLFSLTRRKRRLEMTARREHLVRQMRLEYIHALENSDLLDYKLMERYVHPCIHNVYHHFREIAWSRAKWTNLLKFEQKKAESMVGWMKWFILKEGPSLFWDQWWRHSERTDWKITLAYYGDGKASGLSSLDRMLYAYHAKSKEQIKIESEAASCITSYFDAQNYLHTNIGSDYEYLQELSQERDSAWRSGQFQTPVNQFTEVAFVPFLFEECPLTHKRMNLDTTLLYPKQPRTYINQN